MRKTWKWAVTGFNFPDKSHAEIIEICQYAGISSVEAIGRFVNEQTDAELQRTRSQYEEAGLCMESFHLPMRPDDDAACFYETTRLVALERMLVTLEKAAILGCRTAVLHPTACRFNAETEGIERFLLALGKSLDVLLERAGELDIVIALENMLPGLTTNKFGSLPEHFILLAEKFSHPNLGFCLDTGHAQIACGNEGPRLFLDAMSQHLKAFHIQDNPGDRDVHLAPGYGLIDWTMVFGRMAKMEFSHCACIETPPFAHGPNHSYSRESWKKLIDETEALAQRSIREYISQKDAV